jgi:hypothetical protein
MKCIRSSSPLRRRLAGIALFLILLIPATASSFGADRKEGAPEESRKSPKLALSATPAFGFSPLNVQLVATLKGVESRDPNFCHASVTWVRIDPGTSQDTGTRLTETPRCLHDEGEVAVTTTFSKTFDLYAPGAYLYQVIVDGKDGTQVRSNYIKVQVMRVP